MQGVLENFFPHPGIAFDPETGLFRIANRYRSCVRLRGDGLARAMAEKALRRIGIDPTAETAETIVTATDAEFLLEQAGRQTRCRNIAELLDQLDR